MTREGQDNGRHMETWSGQTWTDSHECEASANVAATWRQAGNERVDMTDDGKVRNGRMTNLDKV